MGQEQHEQSTKQAGLKARTALSHRNIQEHTAAECTKTIQRNRNSQTNALRTNPELLTTVYVVNPPLKEHSK